MAVTLTHLVKLDDVWMVQQLHDLHLPVDLLQVRSIQLGLIYDLYGHLHFDADVNDHFGVADTHHVFHCLKSGTDVVISSFRPIMI